jgi:hypothetical protein
MGLNDMQYRTVGVCELPLAEEVQGVMSVSSLVLLLLLHKELSHLVGATFQCARQTFNVSKVSAGTTRQGALEID